VHNKINLSLKYFLSLSCLPIMVFTLLQVHKTFIPVVLENIGGSFHLSGCMTWLGD